MRSLGLFKINTLMAALVCSLILSACQQGKQSPVVPSSAAAGDNTGGPEGTRTGAGGNGAFGKVYEGFAVNISQTEPFKKYLAALFGTDKDGQSEIQNLLDLKTWFIAPVTIATLQKNQIGLYFIDEETKQFALQNNLEVWIAQTAYDAMSSDAERARLLLHEIMVQVYLLRFEDQKVLNKRMCLLRQSKGGNCDLSGKEMNEQVSSALLAEDKRELNGEDYARIRRATSYLFEIAKTNQKLESMEMIKILAAFEFGSMWKFISENSQSNANDASNASNEKIELSTAAIHQLMEATKYNNTMFECQNFITQESFPCSLSFERFEADVYNGVGYGDHSKFLKVTIRSTEKEMALNRELVLHEAQDQKLTPYYSAGASNVDPNGDLYVGSGLRSTKGYREPGEGYDVINAYMWNPDTRSQNVRFAGFTIQTKIFVATVVDPTTSAEKTRIFDDARSLDPNIGPLIVTVIESEKTRDEIRADASRRMKTLLPRK